MATKGSRSTRRSGGSRSTAKKPTNLYQTLMGIGLWVLGIFNTVLIASFVMKHVSTGDEQIIRVDQPAVAAEQPVMEVIDLEIRNGCGEKGVAKKFADFLEARNSFKALDVSNFDNFNILNTIIIDRKTRSRWMGLKVAETLGLPKTSVTYQTTDNPQIDVSIIIGKDYAKAGFLRSSN